MARFTYEIVRLRRMGDFWMATMRALIDGKPGPEYQLNTDFDGSWKSTFSKDIVLPEEVEVLNAAIKKVRGQ